MPHYKAPDNSLHFIESEFSHLLPAGSVQITDEEAEALRPVPTNEDVKNGIKAQLAALDQKKIRPMAEGDLAYLATLNEQTVELRSKLAAL